ncbi:MAG: spore coat associated protein CotJA [Clostridia bacterium]|nr:spore coat associated protein CotJA [Clostridia bacterium]
MNRNDRYSRRAGCVAGRQNLEAQKVNLQREAENLIPDNCLCANQPISLAISYVKSQPFGEVYSASEALRRGTLFPDLDKPYCIGGRGR